MIVFIMAIFLIVGAFSLIGVMMAFVESNSEVFSSCVIVTAICWTILLFAAIGNNMVSAIEALGGK